MHAHNTIEEAEKFVANEKASYPAKKGAFRLFAFEENDYWILKIRGNKDKINYLLHYIPERNSKQNMLQHTPSNLYRAQLKLPSLILEVINYKRTVKITNEITKNEEALNRSEVRPQF